MTSTAIAVDLVAFSAQIACVIAVAGLLSLAIRIDPAGLRYQYWRGSSCSACFCRGCRVGSLQWMSW
jgi:hypothetical protein